MAAKGSARSMLRLAMVRVFDTSLGRRILGSVGDERPDLLAAPLGYFLSRDSSIAAVKAWPSELTGFEYVAPIVLSSNAANRGIASMRLDEAALLWQLAAAAGPATLVEIGRERGGSTLILAAAMHKDAVLYSFDPQTKHTAQGGKFDDELVAALTRFRLIDRVNIVHEDSQLAHLPDGEFGLVLVDGDPSLEGTRADFARFCTRLRPGGHALFHDAAADGPRRGTLEPLIAEIDRDERFARQPDTGTFVHFRRA